MTTATSTSSLIQTVWWKRYYHHGLNKASPLLRNALSYVGAEISVRVTRIIAMIFVARSLSPEMFVSSPIFMYQFLIESQGQADACLAPDAGGYDCTA